MAEPLFYLFIKSGYSSSLNLTNQINCESAVAQKLGLETAPRHFQLWPRLRRSRFWESVYPTGLFKNVVPRDQEIGEYYYVRGEMPP